MSTASALACAVLAGGILGGGLILLLAALPRWSAVPLARRIAPYLRDVVAEDDLPAGARPRQGILPAGDHRLWTRAHALFGRALGGSDALRLRLAQSGSAIEQSAFRGRQLGWVLAGIAAGAIGLIAAAV